MKKKNSPLPVIIGMIILVLVVGVGYFAALKFKEKKNSEKADISFTETEVLLGIDLKEEENYPKKSREVIKLYSRILMCLYNDTEITAEDFEALVMMQRELYDAELLAINPVNSNITALMEEASEYAEKNKRISDYEIMTVSNIENWKDEGKSYASMTARYIVIEGGVSSSIYQKFLLRYDNETARWKILGWEASSKEDMK